MHVDLPLAATHLHDLPGFPLLHTPCAYDLRGHDLCRGTSGMWFDKPYGWMGYRFQEGVQIDIPRQGGLAERMSACLW